MTDVTAFEPANIEEGVAAVAVIGAGPVGLSVATHLRARGIKPVILEQGERAGAAVRNWGHVPMFSTWKFNIDPAARELLEKQGWTAPDPATYPTGHQLADDYLDPLAAIPEIAECLRLGTRVTGVARTHTGKVRTADRNRNAFVLNLVDRHGWQSTVRAKAVIDATGTWTNPNPAGASGLPALGETDAADRIHYGMPDVHGADRDRYAGRQVLVVGSGHSAIGTLIDLSNLSTEAPGTDILWARRGTGEAAYGGGDTDALPRRGALGARVKQRVETGAITVVAPFYIDAVSRAPDGSLLVSGNGDGGEIVVGADEMIVATGLRPDLDMLREVRLDLDPALECPRTLAPLIDPNIHSCGTVPPHGAHELLQPEPNLFLIGMKSYGRAPTFLLATGYEQARSVAAYLAGDLEAAKHVALQLPETGVCSGPGIAAAEACCGGPAPAGVDACCADDAAAKAAGEVGCDCDDSHKQPAADRPTTGCCGQPAAAE